ncbi:hypothetical protein HMPREF2909_06035 [Alloscardovia sp. HMSC034E08]|nr:hypothetical protein HMPREF2909_06035 [Alloscardovia sp. HMSC034E08]
MQAYEVTKFKKEDSTYSKDLADYAVSFIECLTHTKGTWAGKPFKLLDWQEQIIRDLFGVVKPNGYRQFNTAYIEIPKKMGKSELAAAIINASYGGDFSTLPAFLSSRFGMDKISGIHDVALSAWALAGLTGNQITAAVLNATGSYNLVFLIVAALYGVALIISYTMVKPQK